MNCPGCATEIRLTDGERASGRGYCLVCDARFDVVIERTGALTRGAEVAIGRLALPPPRLRVLACDDTRFVARIRDRLFRATRIGIDRDTLTVGKTRVETSRIERLYVDGGHSLVARLTDGTSLPLPIARRPLPATTLDWLRVRLAEKLGR